MIGTILSTPSLEIAEILALSELEWLFIDHEHSVLNEREIQNIISVINRRKKCFVRIAENSEHYIKRILDTGCDGIIVPQINTEQDAERLVSYSKYPPFGLRSVGLGRSSEYGLRLKGYIEKANDNISVIAQIENIKAIENLDAILNVKGIDGIFIGPYDLSCSMGIAGQINHPNVLEKISFIKKKAIKKKMPWGIFCGTIESVKKEKDEEAAFIAVGSDLIHLSNAISQLIKVL